jgi:hypothetical protein
MLAVAAQLPAAVPADEAGGADAIASAAQMADTAAFMRTMNSPLLVSMSETRVGSKRYACLTRPLNDRERRSGSAVGGRQGDPGDRGVL